MSKQASETPGIAPEVLAAGKHLAALDRQGREQAFKQIRVLVVANLPDDQVPEPYREVEAAFALAAQAEEEAWKAFELADRASR
ncbi:MAG: hypothetical protein AABM43_12125 [Actinomycetota bacterium]